MLRVLVLAGAVLPLALITHHLEANLLEDGLGSYPPPKQDDLETNHLTPLLTSFLLSGAGR